jgi:NodT family efflux transporter outer membrane factor (OMF) lipoprotein
MDDPTAGGPAVRRFLRPAFWVAGLLALAPVCGCTPLAEYVHNGFKVGPNYGRAPAPVARQWIDADDVRVRSTSDDLSRWWAVFNDPALDLLVRTAYGQNLTLRQAGFRVLEARAQLGVSVGYFFPQQQAVSGSYTRYGLSNEVANREFIPKRFFGQWDVGFGAAWELDFWGRYRRAIEASVDDLDASVENYDDVLVTLLSDVATAYVQMRTLEEQIRLTKKNVALQQETLKLAKARTLADQKSELDVEFATSILAQTEALVPQLEVNLRQTNDRLCVLLGIPPEELRSRIGQAPEKDAIPSARTDAVAVGIPADLLRRRPDVRRAERQAAAECARIGVADAEFYPHIILSGAFGYQAEHVNDLIRPTAFTGTFGPSFQWNILQYGRVLNSVRAQDARFQQAVAGYQTSVVRAGEEVEDGLVTFLKSQDAAKYLAESVDAARKAVAIVLARYKAGQIDFTPVAQLEQNLVQQQNQLAQAQAEIALGLIQVYRALGGGWEIRCGPGAGPQPAPAPAPAPKATFPEDRP